MRIRTFGLALTLAWGLALTAAADDLAQVEKAIAEAYGKVRSCRGKMASEVNMETPGFSMKSTTTGAYEFARKDGKFYSRSENKESGETKVGDQVTKTEGSTLSIVDPEYVYSLSEQNGVKTANKMKLQQNMDEQPLAAMRKTHEIKLLPEETVNGAACYVIEATPKEPGMAAVQGKLVQYFTKEHGFAVKSVSFGPDGKPTFTMTFTDLEFNVDISPDRFKFVAPEGVTVEEVAIPAQTGDESEEP
jgi:outer membrane lipoprotein-sorting protein